MRKRKLPAEYISAIGDQAFDLLSCDLADTIEAFDLCWMVNPQVFAWLSEQLNAAKARSGPRDHIAVDKLSE